jgi:hypothetical protein
MLVPHTNFNLPSGALSSTTVCTPEEENKGSKTGASAKIKTCKKNKLLGFSYTK